MNRRKKMLLFMPIILIAISLFAIQRINIYSEENDNLIIKNGPRNEKVIAITFDDGPHPKETNQILDVLKDYDVKATFFVAGKHVEWYPEAVIRATKEGHEIGNHTFSHPDIKSISKSQLEQELLKAQNIIYDKTGKKPTLFRPPYGSYNKNIVELSKKHNYKIVLWSTLDAKDWSTTSPNKIANVILNKVTNGDILVLHDYGTIHPNPTIQALRIFIPEMKKRGYEFVTVSELINYSKDKKANEFDNTQLKDSKN